MESIAKLQENVWRSYITSGLGVCLGFLAYKYWKQNRTLPPGPIGYSLLGCIPRLGEESHHRMRAWAKQYGDIYSMYLGNQLVVVINSYEMMKEAFGAGSESFAEDRPATFYSKYLAKGGGIIWSNGYPWKRHRKLALTALRSLGAITHEVERPICEEMPHMLATVSSKNSTSFDLADVLVFTVSNVMSRIIFNKRYEENDAEYKKILSLMVSWVSKYNFVNTIINVFPVLTRLPGNLFNSKESYENIKTLLVFFRREVEKHRMNLNEDDPRDFVDKYLIAQRKEGFSDHQIEIVIRDLFVAGVETTAFTLAWGMLFMVLYPEIQEKVYREIRENLADDEEIRSDHRERLPFTAACLYEIQRVANISPISLPRCTTRDVIFHGYQIPKGTDIYPNYFAVNLDERYFQDATTFKPERYLDANGNLFRLQPYLNFGMGQRMCFGEVMAKIELFIVFSNLIRHFEWTPGSDVMPQPLEGIFGMVFVPHPYKVRATPRK